MLIDKNKLVENLNDDNVEIRLESLQKLKSLIDQGKIPKPSKKNHQVNNHIHTTFSFSPYSPTRAIWEAYQAGLITAGIMDHDSIMGAKEFIRAGEIIGIATTVGIEYRVDFTNTKLQGKRINHPDEKSKVYMALHGVPHTKIEQVQQFFTPYREARNRRNQKMVKKLNKILKPYKLELDFTADIIPISESLHGGTITERHICFALSQKLIDKFGKGEKLLNFLKENFNFSIPVRIEKYLVDQNNPYYAYDLLGLMKKDLISSFYIKATDECPDVNEVIGLAGDIQAISAYAYLGDIEESVTGDKKAQKFEDDYLELLFSVIKELGFIAVTYMPTRNTLEQLLRVQALCEEYDFFQISGEDINSPRQSFICEALKREEFYHLIDSTWALIGHEKAATKKITDGMFSKETIKKIPSLNKRIEIYQEIGRDKA